MIRHIIKKELLENFLSLRFAITTVMCVLVVTSSIGILGREYVDDLFDYTRNSTEQRKDLESKEHPWELVYRGAMIAKPVAKMSIFNKGIDDSGKSAKVFGHKEPEIYNQSGKNPVSFLFPSIDILFFVSVIMSLLAIVFSYDAISGEKFNETLKLMVSYPVSRNAIIIGKWIGGFLCLMLPFLLSVTAGLMILLVIVPDFTFTGTEALKLLLLIFLSGLFVSIVYTFGILISANTEKPSSSITVLLLIWVVFVLIIPNISSSAASFFVNVGNIQEIEGSKRKIVKDARSQYWERLDKYRRDKGYGWRDPEFRLYRDVLRRDMYNESRIALDNVNRDFRLRMNRQITLTKWISRLSPLSSLKYAAGLITETGYREDEMFRTSVNDYARELMTFTYDQWVEEAMDEYRVRTGQQSERKWEFDKENIPKFQYENLKQKGIEVETAQVMIDIGFLIFWNIVFFMGAYISFIRYDVK